MSPYLVARLPISMVSYLFKSPVFSNYFIFFFFGCSSSYSFSEDTDLITFSMPILHQKLHGFIAFIKKKNSKFLYNNQLCLLSGFRLSSHTYAFSPTLLHPHQAKYHVDKYCEINIWDFLTTPHQHF